MDCRVGVAEARLRSYQEMMSIAIGEAREGLAEGGIPIGAAIFQRSGEGSAGEAGGEMRGKLKGDKLISSGRNRRVQDSDPSAHGETDAFRRAGRQRSYRDLIMVTTLAPCWFCSGLIRQFGFRTVIVGESRNFQGGVEWLRAGGIEIIDLESQECTEFLSKYIQAHPDVWNEDIGMS